MRKTKVVMIQGKVLFKPVQWVGVDNQLTTRFRIKEVTEKNLKNGTLTKIIKVVTVESKGYLAIKCLKELEAEMLINMKATPKKELVRKGDGAFEEHHYLLAHSFKIVKTQGYHSKVA